MSGLIDYRLNIPKDNISSSKLQEFNDLLSMLKNEKEKCIKSEIFKDIILEAAGDRIYGIQNLTGVKIRDIILRGELIKNLSVKDNISGEEISLLDKEEFCNIELSFEEQKELKIAVEQRIRNKNETLLKDVRDITDCDSNTIQDIIENMKFDAQAEKENIIASQKRLKELHRNHINALLNLGDVLLKLVKLRNEIAPKHMEQKAEELYCESKKFNLRLRIFEQKTRIALFTETPMSLEAYRQAYKDIKEQQTECSKTIQELKSDMEKYNILSRNEKYQEILEDYKQHVKSIEKKKLFHLTNFGTLY